MLDNDVSLHPHRRTAAHNKWVVRNVTQSVLLWGSGDGKRDGRKWPLHYAMGGTLFFLLAIGKGGDGSDSNNGCNDNDDNNGKDYDDNGKLWQQPLLPPLFVRCQNFEKRCQTFGRKLFAHNFGSTFQHMCNRTCLFLLHFWTDLIGLRKNVTCHFSNGPKLTKLNITKVLLASCKKMLAKMRKAVAELVSWQNYLRTRGIRTS